MTAQVPKRNRNRLAACLVGFLFLLSTALILPGLKVNNWCMMHDHLALEVLDHHEHADQDADHDMMPHSSAENCVTSGSVWTMTKESVSPEPYFLEISCLNDSQRATLPADRLLRPFLAHQRPDIRYGHPPLHALRSIVLIV